MDPSLKFACDEILRRLDELDALMEQRFSRTMATLEQRSATVELRVGGLGQAAATQLVEADNWGSLFDEIPAPDTTYSGSDALPFFTPAPEAASELPRPASEQFVSIALEAACVFPAVDALQELESLGINGSHIHSVDKFLVRPSSTKSPPTTPRRAPPLPQDLVVGSSRPAHPPTSWRRFPVVRLRRLPHRQAILARCAGSDRAPTFWRCGRSPRRRRRPPRLLVRDRRPCLRARAWAPQPREVPRQVCISSCSASAVVNSAPTDAMERALSIVPFPSSCPYEASEVESSDLLPRPPRPSWADLGAILHVYIAAAVPSTELCDDRAFPSMVVKDAVHVLPLEVVDVALFSAPPSSSYLTPDDSRISGHVLGRLDANISAHATSRSDIYSPRSMGFSSTTPRPSNLTNAEIDSLEPQGMGFREYCYSMVSHSCNFAGDAFGLRTGATPAAVPSPASATALQRAHAPASRVPVVAEGLGDLRALILAGVVFATRGEASFHVFCIDVSDPVPGNAPAHLICLHGACYVANYALEYKGIHHRYHDAVTFAIGIGICAFESSSRAWAWTLGTDVADVEAIELGSEVGALGCAFWRTTMVPFLCYEPASCCVDLIPAPVEMMRWAYWELGEMEGMLCFSCMGARVDIFIAFGVDPRNADEPVRTDAIYAIESFHIGPVECALRADAVGATGGGQLAWVVAAGSAPTNCSTLCLAGSHYFGNVPGGAFWEEEVLHRGDDNYNGGENGRSFCHEP
ncbi:unnamed protein product [Miscanthus lutarioriparius]|uniref:Uncharacterized protein n=1 Tax=Miscanthus lutarioriparius TaxID=422564 RepID=A0A811NVQ8_9POAL|nr:unnamed protein product [Miscanthus lutarioriparius]